MDASLYDLIAKGGIGAVCIYLLSLAAPKFFDSILAARGGVAESGARIDIIEQLTAQVARLSQSVQDLEKKHDDERALRLAAENKVSVLTQRVGLLEAQIRQLGHQPI